jgi:putrescine aminotransferase
MTLLMDSIPSESTAETTGADRRADVLAKWRSHVNSGLARLAEFLGAGVEIASEGPYLYDEKGTQYLDCGGYNVFLLGHRHPAVVEAVSAQLHRHPLASRLLLNGDLPEAAVALARVAPEGLDYVWLANSGAEATEAALKLGWLGGCRRLIAMRGGYHGKTLGALGVTYNPTYRKPYEGLLPQVAFLPYGDAAALADELGRSSERACVILEPVQSECGVIIPPDGYLKEVERIARQSGAFFVLDEISTGLGRMGWWWGADREGVRPDVLLAGKALSGGVMPVSAAICTEEAFAPLNKDPFLHTSTFAGNPLAAAAVRAAVETIERDGLVMRSREIGERLLSGLRAIVAEHCPHMVRDVRGLGLLVGIEFHDESQAARLLFELIQRQVLVSHSLNAHRVVRVTPPAILTDAQFDRLMAALKDSAAAVAR